ncbi:MAG: 4Fe-4S dicluster domain-containing protein [Clostridiales bacterium]|nr:4Fe-4S dicluster domain-containing protein [Clostridiales bacterium]
MEFEIIIDGKSLKAKAGETILEVARRNNIDIPTLCYLKHLNEPASCRVCVVEVEGMPKLVTACSTKVREGMNVKTNTTKVLKARKTALELLLSNHNKNCLNCPKNLKCDFQKLTEQFMCNTEHYAGEMLETTIDDSNHSLVRDMSKCILCGKCVAVCSQRQGCSVYSKINRGFTTKVGTAFDGDLQSSPCVGCGQCILVCPTGALSLKNDLSPVLDILAEEDVVTVAQVAPAVRVSIAEEFGNEIGTFAEGKMVSALKKIGFDYVFDVNNGADFTVIEEGNELIGKLQSGKDLPLFTSCCPAWFNYVEKNYPEFKHNLSSSKSPNEMLGSLVKYYFEKQGKKVRIVSVMPCTAKKREILSHGVIDKVITTRELGQLIKLKGIDFNSLEDEKFDNPFGEYTGAGLIFGVTGGVTEAALRYAIYKLTGKKQDIIEDVRYSEGIKEVDVDLQGKTVKLAIVHGLANAPKVLDAIKRGEKHYDFVEVMACPGGCVNGGGQSFVDYNKVDVEEVISKRSHAIYKADGDMKFRTSDENESVAKIYNEMLNNDEHLIHELLHYIHTED